MKSHKDYLYPLLVVFLLLLPLAGAVEWEFNPSDVHFYMYGMSTCPHCRHMKEAIPATYGPERFTYYELNGNRHNDAIFQNISRLTGITGVPAIGIMYNGSLVAVIEGEFNVSATPEIVKAAIEHNGTLLFVGGRGYILPHNDSRAINVVEELTKLFLEGQPEGRTTTKVGKGICGPALVVAIAIVPLLLRKE